MVVIFFGLDAGSRQREGMEPLSALFTVTLYLFSISGFAIRAPKSMYSSFHILALILSETRASSGKLDETNSWSGIGCLGPMVSPVRFFWTAVIESCTKELLVAKGSVKGTSAKAFAEGRAPLVLAIRNDTSSATLVTSWSINSGGSMEFDTGDTSVASGSEGVVPVPEAIADGGLHLFCLLAAGGLGVEAEGLAERFAGITARRTQIKAETEALPNSKINVKLLK